MPRNLTITDQHNNNFRQWHDHILPFTVEGVLGEFDECLSETVHTYSRALKLAQDFNRILDKSLGVHVTITDATGHRWYVQ